MTSFILLLAWPVSIGTILVAATAALVRQRRHPDGWVYTLPLALLPSLIACAAWLQFLRVFIIGGSSNVAQIASGGDMSLWSEWLHAWPLYFYTLPFAVIWAAVFAFLPSYPPRHWFSFTARLANLGNCLCALYCIITLFPDA